MLPLFTIIHPLVDACSVSVLVAGGVSLPRVLAYNALAFALQLPMGMLMDARPRLLRGGFFLGTLLVTVSAACAAFGLSGWVGLAAACTGNALFHLTAGKHILETHDGRGGPIGFFISTGAFGLMAGQVWAAKAASASLLTFAAALAACVTYAATRHWTGPASPTRNTGAERLPDGALILLGLFVLIAWRSWAGLFAGGRSVGGGALMMLVAAGVAFLGKALGGCLAGCAGRWPVTTVSVIGSALLAFVCEPSATILWLALLFVAQLATGPVLSLVYDRLAARGGTAFGLNCLGLFLGSLV